VVRGAGARRLKPWAEHRRLPFVQDPPPAGLEPPKGLLLLGVQGCGKSLLAKAVAGGFGVPLVRLDFGNAMSPDGRPVTAKIGERLWPTMQLAFASMMFAILIGVPLGFLAALKPGGWLDMHPDFSPDGTRIAFRRNYGNSGLYVLDLVSGQETRLFAGNIDAPSWSPYGDEIVFDFRESDDQATGPCNSTFGAQPSRCFALVMSGCR